jgi:uncharacterized membrane protein YhhN
VTDATWVLLGVAAVFAVGDWIAVTAANKAAEYVCKPAATSLLLAAAAVLSPEDSGQRTAFVVALALSLIGDVALMVPGDRLVVGLGAFLLGHVAYIVGFTMLDGDTSDYAIAGAAVAVIALILGTRIVRALLRGGHRELVGPVVAYVLAIGVMVTCAIAVGNAWAIAGAVLFFTSDALIAEQRFVQPRRFVPVLIMITYHVAQAGLVVSLAQ